MNTALISEQAARYACGDPHPDFGYALGGDPSVLSDDDGLLGPGGDDSFHDGSHDDRSSGPIPGAADGSIAGAAGGGGGGGGGAPPVDRVVAAPDGSVSPSPAPLRRRMW